MACVQDDRQGKVACHFKLALEIRALHFGIEFWRMKIQAAFTDGERFLARDPLRQLGQDARADAAAGTSDAVRRRIKALFPPRTGRAGFESIQGDRRDDLAGDAGGARTRQHVHAVAIELAGVDVRRAVDQFGHVVME